MISLSKVNNLLKIEKLSSRKAYKILFLIICLFLFFVINVLSLFFPLKKTLSYDERYYYDSGLAILDGKSSERAKVIGHRNILPASSLNTVIGKIIPDKLKSRLLGSSFSQYEQKVFFGKLATILVSLILAIYVFRWAEDLYGVHSGFLALILYVFDPNIIAHSRQVHQDIIGACAIFVATYYFWKVLQVGGHWNSFLSIVTFGLSQITRFTALYSIPIFLLLACSFYGSSLIQSFKTRNFDFILRQIKNSLIYILLIILTTIIIINISFSFDNTFEKLSNYKFESEALNTFQSAFPRLSELRIPIPSAYLLGVDFVIYKNATGFGSGPAYLMGKLGVEDGRLKGFKEYYIVAFLYKVPLGTQLLILLAIVALIFCKNKRSFLQNEAFLIIPSLFYFISLSFSNAQLGIRYIIMIFPFLFVLSSRIALSWITFNLWNRIIVIGLVVYIIISSLSYFPHYLSYFNELLLDRKRGYEILADSNLHWGQNGYYVEEYLKKHPTAVLLSINPDSPIEGLVVIDANALVGLWNPDTYKWVRDNLEPIDHVAYSYFVFDVKAKDISY